MSLHNALKTATFLLVLLVFSGPRPAGAASQKRLTIYGTQTSFSVDLFAHAGQDYAGLVDVLEPLGRVESRVEGSRLRLKFNNTECEFQDGSSRARVRNSDLNLPASFALINHRGFIPASALPAFLSRLTDQRADFHAAARRLFLGVQPVRFTAELRRNPSRLVLSFPVAVSPNVATEPGRLRLSFLHSPVVSSGNDNLNFGDPLIAGANFAEGNGAGELIVRVNAPAQASYSDGGRTITVSAAPAQAATAPRPQPETPLPPPHFDRPSAPIRMVEPAAPNPRFLVVIDPAHGGPDQGDALTNQLSEKEYTLAFARRVARALDAHGMAVTLLRTSDTALTLDQRANAANTSHARVYIALHASIIGRGVRTYTALLPPGTASSDRRAFAPWETAQAAWLDASTALASAVADRCRSRALPVRTGSAAARPLNNVATIAIAVEIAPPGNKPDEINSGKYQENVASAIAEAVDSARARLGAAQ